MAQRLNIAALKAISQAPATGEAEWLIAAEDSVAFLRENVLSEEMVIYASAPATLIHAVLAPSKQVTPADQKDLMHAFVQTDESWAIQKSYGGGEGHRVYLEAPLRSGKSLADGENETANTVALPLYAKQALRQFDRGTDLHTQSNPLPLCHRPGLLVKLTMA